MVLTSKLSLADMFFNRHGSYPKCVDGGGIMIPEGWDPTGWDIVTSTGTEWTDNIRYEWKTELGGWVKISEPVQPVDHECPGCGSWVTSHKCKYCGR